ncbi:MAG: nucleotidyl transferase AbiEii/AbiGii toxin family protein [Bacteroidales bacterium]|jgi:predicted nucleotidyltransferase component of viral defense system|nr:nucleotidyl transferase AbiEii/AbiGii toxin family protein [Bacteroidales bacterium]
MMDINKHKFYLVQLLKAIYSDAELSKNLGFKGGTALMFFYDLPRFSVDLDFNLLDITKSVSVYNKLRQLCHKHGKIHDEAKKFYGDILVLDYGQHERKLKIEVSHRQFEDKYEIKNLLGIHVKVMTKSDMFSHKLCALTDRASITNRDIFDIWFLMSQQTPINEKIIQNRMNQNLTEYLDTCIQTIEKMPNRHLLDGLGELVNPELKTFVRNKLRQEVISLFKFYKQFPIKL